MTEHIEATKCPGDMDGNREDICSNPEIILEKENNVTINNVVIHNRDLYDILYEDENKNEKSPTERIECITDIINVGTATMKNSATKTDVNYVKREFADIRQHFNDTMTNIRDDINNDLKANIATDIADPLKNQIQNHMKNLADHTTRSLTAFETKITNKMENIQNALVYKEALSDQPGKGITFEQNFKNVLDRIVGPYCDSYIHTGTTPSINKDSYKKDYLKGDYTITIYGIPLPYKNNIVTELKSLNETSDWSFDKANDYLDKSVKNRNAAFGIMVFEGDIPEKIRQKLNITDPTRSNNKMCALRDFNNTYLRVRQILLQLYYDSLKRKYDRDIIILKQRQRHVSPEHIELIKIAIQQTKVCVEELERIDTIRSNIIKSIEDSKISTKELGTYRDDMWRHFTKAQASLEQCLIQHEIQEKNNQDTQYIDQPKSTTHTDVQTDTNNDTIKDSSTEQIDTRQDIQQDKQQETENDKEYTVDDTYKESQDTDYQCNDNNDDKESDYVPPSDYAQPPTKKSGKQSISNKKKSLEDFFN